MMAEAIRAQHLIHPVPGEHEHQSVRPGHDRPRAHLLIEGIRIVAELPLSQPDKGMNGCLLDHGRPRFIGESKLRMNVPFYCAAGAAQAARIYAMSFRRILDRVLAADLRDPGCE